jgi:hypothetical protein
MAFPECTLCDNARCVPTTLVPADTVDHLADCDAALFRKGCPAHDRAFDALELLDALEAADVDGLADRASCERVRRRQPPPERAATAECTAW